MVRQSLEEITEIIKNTNDFLNTCKPITLSEEYIEIKYGEEILQDDTQHMQLKCNDLFYPFAASPVISTQIKDAQILYDGPIGSKKFMQITLDYAGVIEYHFNPGDTIGILVSNSDKDVSFVLGKLLPCNSPDIICDIGIKSQTKKKNLKVPQHVPIRSTPRAILRDCLDIKCIPKKSLLRSLAEYTSSENERNLLMLLSSKQGNTHYNQFVLEERRTFLDVLQICSSCGLPLSLLIEHLPRLKPRPYSIANSPLSNASEVKLIFSILSKTPGVATSYLADRVNSFLGNSSKTLNFYFRESNNFTFQHKEDSVLIGIGCGVSPFLGFLEHKKELMKQNLVELGSTWLFTGSTCQDSAVYRDDLIDYQQRGVLQHLYESFSRDPDPDCGDFQYVQDHLKANASKLVEMLTKKGTNLYVCADGMKISKSIEDCIKECLVNVLKCANEEAEAVIKDMRAVGRYKEDIWV